MSENSEFVTTVWMKSKQGENEFSMFVNENFEHGHGGYAFEVLDFEPEKSEEYTKLYVTLVNMYPYILEVDNKNNELQEQLTTNKRIEVLEDALKYISEDKDDESISGMWVMQYAAKALAKSEQIGETE